MEKSRRSTAEAQDRLSALPNSVTFHIFSFLTMTDVVKTTILSKSWKNLWTTATTLNFKDFKMRTDDTDNLFLNRVRNFINRVLIFWRGTRIQEFNIDFGKRFNKSIYDDVDLWLQFAKKHKVEALHVHFGEDSIQPTRELYRVPQCLYSYSSVTELHLEGCKVHIPINNVISWNQLKYLHLDCYGVTADLINKVLLGSPQLETLFFFYFVGNNDNLTVQSTSLRHLSIQKDYVDDNPPVDTELRILTPNLEHLILHGVPYWSVLINSVPSLTLAYLNFRGPLNYRETLRQILPTIQHVETVKFSDRCIKALGDMKKKNILLPFPNVKKLELKVYFEEYEQVVCLLELFPELETFTIQLEKGSKKFQENQPHGCRESVELEANLPNFFLQKLRTIVITWAEGQDSILPLIETVEIREQTKTDGISSTRNSSTIKFFAFGVAENA